MLEALLSGRSISTPPAPPVVLLDAATGGDLMGSKGVLAVASGASVDSAILIDGQPTWKFASTAGQVKFTFEKPLNLEGKDWTVEWSMIDNNISSTYVGILDILDASLAQGITSRFNDGPYGNRLMFGTAAIGTSDSYTVDVTQAQIQGVLTRFAFQCRANRLTFYVNGVPKLSSVGTNLSFNAESRPKSGNLSAQAQILLGYRASSVVSFLGNMGRVRISDFARYSGTYTPVAF